MSGISLTAVKMFVPTVPAVRVGELVPVVPDVSNVSSG
jgi:hypothetical protein